MNKTNPLNANPNLKPDVKNDAKVKATRERLARSIDFSAYNLRWNSFISISKRSITYAFSLSRAKTAGTSRELLDRAKYLDLRKLKEEIIFQAG